MSNEIIKISNIANKYDKVDAVIYAYKTKCYKSSWKGSMNR